jgi:hypothetical protein
LQESDFQESILIVVIQKVGTEEKTAKNSQSSSPHPLPASPATTASATTPRYNSSIGACDLDRRNLGDRRDRAPKDPGLRCLLSSSIFC